MGLLLAMLAMPLPAGAQGFYSWTNFVGQPGGAGNADGTGSAARFNAPRGVAVDGAGDVYVADYSNHTIRKVTPGGQVTTLAGSPGAIGNADGIGSAARFRNPSGVTVDTGGNVYVADYLNHTIRKITAVGVVTTLAGSPGLTGSTDATGTAARFNRPSGVAVDGSGNVYVADQNNYTIRKVTSAGVVTTLAGSAGLSDTVNGTGSTARFVYPAGVALDGTGSDLYVADQFGYTIRKVVTATGEVTTLAGNAGVAGGADGNGTAAQFDFPVSVTVDGDGNVYVADQRNHTIRKVTPAGGVTTLAGSAGMTGSTDATGNSARFSSPSGVAVDGAGNIYVGDQGNHMIRKIAAGAVVTTLAGSTGASGSTDGTGALARFGNPRGIWVDSADTSFVADQANHTIRTVTSAGVVTTLAGSAGNTGSADGVGTAARFNNPSGIGQTAAGDLYVADQTNHTIRKVTPGGEVTTIAGSAGVSGNADGTGGSASFSYPSGLAVRSATELYVADQLNHTIRKVTTAGVVTTFVGSPGFSGSADGIGAAARFNQPGGLALDNAGNLYVADLFNHTIRKVTPGGDVTTLAGNPGVRGGTDGTGSAARFNLPSGVAVDSSGNVFVADLFNSTIRRVTAGGVVTTIGGVTGVVGGLDGVGSAAQFAFPSGIALGSAGRLFVSDGSNNRITRGTPSGTEARLSNLSLSQGTLTPAFLPDTPGYTATVDFVVSSLTVTPTLVDLASTVKVNGVAVGSGNPSGSISLNLGPNAITVVVTASDNFTTRTYTVTVTRLTEIESWRKFYFGSPENTGVGADSNDADGDGQVNGSEFAAGLIPTSAASNLYVRAEAVPGQPGQKKIIFSPRFSTRTYVVTFRTDLSTGTWNPLPSSSSSDNGEERTVIDLDATGPQKFYRVEVTYP